MRVKYSLGQDVAAHYEHVATAAQHQDGPLDLLPRLLLGAPLGRLLAVEQVGQRHRLLLLDAGAGEVEVHRCLPEGREARNLGRRRPRRAHLPRALQPGPLVDLALVQPETEPTVVGELDKQQLKLKQSTR